MKDTVLPVSTRAVASLLLIQTNTVVHLSSSEEAENIETRVADAVVEDTSDLVTDKHLKSVPFYYTYDMWTPSLSNDYSCE